MDKVQKIAKESVLKVYLEDRKNSWIQHFYFKDSNYVLSIEENKLKIYIILDLYKEQLNNESFSLYYEDIEKIEMYFTKKSKIELTGIQRNIFFINLKIKNNKKEIYNFQLEGVESSIKLFNMLKDKNINIENKENLKKILLNKTSDELYYYLNHNL